MQNLPKVAPDEGRPLKEVEVPVWHLLPLTVFVIANVAICWAFFNDLPNIQKHLNPQTIILMALATYRIANIVSNEQVSKVIRAPFVNIKDEVDGKETEVPKRSGLRNTIGTLLYCPSCVGVWVAAVITYLFIFSPTLGWIVTAIFALSALERILTSTVGLITKLGEDGR